MENNVAIMNFW